MTRDRVDLSPLDPRGDPPRFDRLVRAIVQDAHVDAQRRSTATAILVELARWTRPALAAAAVVAIAAAGTLMYRRPQPSPRDAGLDEAGIPVAIAEWARTGSHPSALELVAAFRAVAPGDTAGR